MTDLHAEARICLTCALIHEPSGVNRFECIVALKAKLAELDKEGK